MISPLSPRRIAAFLTRPVFLCLLAAAAVSPARAQVPADFLATIKKEAASKAGPFTGLDQWRFLRAELQHLETIANPAFKFAAPRDPVPAMKNFSEALAAKGIKLIVVPVPEKARIRADKLTAAGSAAAPALDEAAGRVYGKLREAGLEVLDLTKTFRGEVAKGEDPGYCRTDSHVSPRMCEVIAASVADSCLKAAPALADAAKKDGPAALPGAPVKIHGDLAAEGDTETLQASVVQTSKTSAAPLEPPATSPVLLMGDSHCLIFHGGGDMLASGSGVFDHLSARLGFSPALMGVRGGGSTAARVNLYRKNVKEPAFLSSVKVVVWCFAARDLTQAADWKVVPLTK